MNPFDKNFNTHISTLPSRIHGMMVRKKANLTYIDTGLNSETFNIIQITNGQHISAHEIRAAVDYFESSGKKYTMWIGKNQFNENVNAILKLIEIERLETIPGMKLDLDVDQIDADLESIHIKLVKSKEDIQAYSRLLANLCTPPDQHVLEFYDKASKPILEKSLPVLYALYYDQEIPIAGVEMCITDERVIGVYGLVTSFPYRKQGVGTTLMKYVINHAKRIGLGSVVLQASDMGSGLYKSLGFKTVTQYYEYGPIIK